MEVRLDTEDKAFLVYDVILAEDSVTLWVHR